jgi:hypothetical protein
VKPLCLARRNARGHEPASPATTLLASFALLCAACGDGDNTQLDDVDLQAAPLGTLALALSTANAGGEFAFVGAIEVVNDGGVVATVNAAAGGSPTHIVALAPGSYSLRVVDGYSCTHAGSDPGFTGCTFVRSTPEPFAIVAGNTTFVTVEISFHFERQQDISALFKTGSAEVALSPRTELTLTCGDGPSCSSTELCATLDGAPPQCYLPCTSDNDCTSPASCITVDLQPPAGAPPQRTAVCSIQ